MRRLTPPLAGVLITALMLLGTACSAEDSAKSAKGGGETLHYAMATELSTLDPAKVSLSFGTGSQAAYAIFDALLVIDSHTGEVKPKVATALSPNRSAKVWTLQLPDGVKFSDGTAYDAAAVKFNFERFADPDVSSVADSASQISEMTVASPTELKIVLAEPNSAFDRIVAQQMALIGSPAAFKKLGEDFGQRPVGAGPFVLDEWVRGSTMTLSRNEGYYRDGRPLVAGLVFHTVPDTTQLATSLKTGQFDMAVSSEVSVIEDLVKAGLRAETLELAGSPYLALNVTRPPFDDPGVRQAMRLAIDTDQAAEVLGAFTPARTPFVAKDDNFGLHWPEVDRVKAQRLFDTYADEHGPIKFTIGAFQRSGSQAEAKFLQAALNEFDHVDVSVEVKEGAAAIGDVMTGNYQAHTWGTPWFVPADLDRYLASGGQLNVFGYKSKVVDTAFAKAQGSTDPEVQATAYGKIVKELVESGPLIMYGNKSYSTVYRENVNNVGLFFDGIPFFEEISKS